MPEFGVQTLDTDAVEIWARDHAPEIRGPIRAEKIAGGQSNPTYLLHAASGDFVLRRKPPGQLLKSAHAVDREYRVQSALAGTEVPVARMIALCDDDSVIGSMFYVMERVHGVNHRDPRLPDLSPPERATVVDEMNRVLAALHEVDVDAVGLSDYGPEGNYYERQISRWTKQYCASEMTPIPAMDRLIDALGGRMPPDDGQRTLVHGDYRIDNMIFDADTHRCNAVLDWELSTLGHPYADLAAVIMQWQLPTGPDGRGLAGFDRAEAGLPSDQAFIDRYCERRGIRGIDDMGFYVAFAFFRMAAILQGVAKRAEDGNASDPERGRAMGRYVPVFAQGGLHALGETG
ncbi:phosphotransferase family protein [uncultured Paracoccus sp.]|uniref:phosphotransferase family protein n=1 Tax=uncultured Paracoccus sp. TaxID=189685 RepID=UPI00261472BA|nr:phosphotransferase family protein [uncultured Paracoccus sp.]